MKKWFKFFGLSFFSHQTAKGGVKRSYANVLLSFVLALVCLWSAFICGDVLPFGTYYNNSPDFMATVHGVLANPDADKRIDAKIEDGALKAKKHGGEYTVGLLVNTFENDADKQIYSANGYNVVVDTRPADTLAEVEAYYISNDGKNTVISYEDYLGLSEVARLNFDFKLKYTGNALELSDESVEAYRSYVDGLGGESKGRAEELANELSEGRITSSEYNRAIYELYFENYYPEISEYESTSAVPLLRNYYYHEYLINGNSRYLFIFDDYLTASFETKGGIDVAFHGFFGDMEDGVIVSDGAAQADASASADGFVKSAYKATRDLTLYAHTMNAFSLAPFIALMIMAVTLLMYSILKLRSVESVSSPGAAFKIVGSFAWFSGVGAAALSVILAFFVGRNLITTLPMVLFFTVLAGRSVIFAIQESQLYTKQLEQQESGQVEV